MLVRLFPEQIAKRWDFIKPAIENSLPLLADSESPDRMNNILESLLLGSMQCWVTYNGDEIKAVTTTQRIFNSNTKSKSLLIYSAYSFGDSSRKDWIKGFKTLVGYAKASGCDKIVAYTDNDDIVTMFKRLGGESRTFLSYVL